MNLQKDLNIKNRYSVRLKTLIDISEDKILHCIDHPELFHDLPGFYSIIIRDLKKKETIIVSDLTSSYKIYYNAHEASFDLNIQEGKEVHLDKEAIRYYLKYRYIPSPLCFYKGLKTLPPGTVIKVDQQGNETILSHYDILFENTLTEQKVFDEKIEKIIANFFSRIDIKESGLFLSGGIDSSAVLYFMKRYLDEKSLTAYSVLFPDERFDEDDFSRQVCKKLKVNRDTFNMTPQDFIDFWKNMPDIFTQPVSTHTGAAYNKIAKNTDVKYMFSGMGGDELFGGDIKYYHAEKLRIFKENMERNDIESSIAPFEEFLGFISFNDEELRLDIREQETLLKQMTWFNIRYWQTEYENYVLNNICEKYGKIHIAPYIEKNFIEMALSIKDDMKIRGYIQRYIYRKWIQKIYGKDFAFRPSQGFSAPLNSLFRDQLTDFVTSSIDSLCQRECLNGIIDKDLPGSSLRELEAGKNNYNIILIHIIFEMYMENFDKNENTVYIS